MGLTLGTLLARVVRKLGCQHPRESQANALTHPNQAISRRFENLGRVSAPESAETIC